MISFIARSQNQQSSAIIHANVVNVITGKIDPDQTILIDSGRIVAVGSTQKIKVPEKTTTILDAKENS
jgi:imidazolonepropionase-like amidohydrolase